MRANIVVTIFKLNHIYAIHLMQVGPIDQPIRCIYLQTLTSEQRLS